MILASLALTGCGVRAMPVDLVLQSNIELPDFGPDTDLKIRLESMSRSAGASQSADPSCLLDAAGCTIEVEASMLGHLGAWGTIWLDVDGNDEYVVERAILDGDPVGVFQVDFSELPYSVPVTLDDPRVVFDG